jgi:galactokinase
VPLERACAFAPGRVNLIGEHTDYNQGLALPFAIAEGVTVRALATGDQRVLVRALDLDESHEFALSENDEDGSQHLVGWRAFVRGTLIELHRAGFPLTGARLEIGGDLAQGAGLSSSAALEVALCLALLALADRAERLDRVELARLCARVENQWVGAHTGLLDQLTSLFGQADSALLIDFRVLEIDPIALRLKDGWRLVTLNSGERHVNASSAYNERRSECARACELLGVRSLREVGEESLERLPDPLRRRAAHVLGENARVLDTVAALRAGDLFEVGALLNASHASLRDCYEVSTPAVELAADRLLKAGAAGARIVGGGFGGHVLGLLPPGASEPKGAHAVRPGPGAHLRAR